MTIKSLNFIFIALLLLYFLFFRYFNEVDLFIAKNYMCDSFFCAKWNRLIVDYCVYMFALVLLYYVSLLILSSPCKKVYYSNKVKFLFLSVISPTISVEFLKEYFGRPRPAHIFNYFAQYVPIFKISDYCTNNCSFPSGDVQAAGILFAVLVALTKNIRISFFIGLFSMCIIGYCRIVHQRHFLSDVLFSMMLVYYLTFLCYFMIYKERKNK